MTVTSGVIQCGCSFCVRVTIASQSVTKPWTAAVRLSPNDFGAGGGAADAAAAADEEEAGGGGVDAAGDDAAGLGEEESARAAVSPGGIAESAIKKRRITVKRSANGVIIGRRCMPFIMAIRQV